MRLWPRTWWPRTLGAQLVAVTAAAVLVSNIAVATWFEMGRERMNQSAVNERLLDRAVSVATLLSAMPAKSRDDAARAVSSGPWQFRLRHDKYAAPAMNDEETALAAKAHALLPEKRRKDPVYVHIGSAMAAPPFAASERRRPDNARRPPPGRPSNVIQVDLPVVRGTRLEMTFFRFPQRETPMELMIGALAAILTASAAAAYIARRVSRPLTQLAVSASEAARGGDVVRVPEEGPEDVRRAAAAFNAMTAQVKRTLDSQRQLLSAVGHDLRTPITALRINTEFVSDPELRERLQKTLAEMQELTEAVLSAARGVGGEKTRRIDLAALVESVCADLDEMGKPVSWQTHDPIPLTGRPNELRRALRNLIENAVAYGKKAEVRVAESESAYTVTVEDEGPGIPQADLTRVFDPFVRLEASRSTETGGTGLGLTLVKSIAEGHGGSINLENREAGGLRATLRLPKGG